MNHIPIEEYLPYRLMALALLAQLLSVGFGWNHLPAGARFTGFCVGMIGDLVFLYRLGADVSMQKKTLCRQMSVFFLSPFLLPLMMTIPVGIIFGEVYRIWNFAGLSGQRAMETAVVIALVIAGIYALYFVITYRIACSNVICSGGEKQEIPS
ncbi:MAG: hypothetical protein PUG60_06810 [Lachnospiraceae bacterium]|nr:hypothetical protein [Lachnospiraceae bacterium]